MLKPEIEPGRHARRTDPETSHEAARQLSNKVTMMRRLLGTFAQAPRTASEAIARAGYGPEDGAWKRVSDLKRLGLIRDTGLSLPGPFGRRQRVLAITHDGLKELS